MGTGEGRSFGGVDVDTLEVVTDRLYMPQLPSQGRVAPHCCGYDAPPGDCKSVRFAAVRGSAQLAVFELATARAELDVAIEWLRSTHCCRRCERAVSAVAAVAFPSAERHLQR